MSVQQQYVDALKETPGDRTTLHRKQFDLTDGTAGERSLVAEYTANGVPFRVMEGVAGRIMFVTAEEFTADGTANTETHNLSYNIHESKNTQNLVLYSDGNRVQPDSVDYANNSFDYTDSGNSETLHAFYVARDPGAVTIEKVAPETDARLSQDLDDETTSGLADRNQNKEPVKFNFTEPLQGVVPKNWKLRVYVDAPMPVRWNDDNLSTTNGDVATNSLVSIPIYQYESQPKGLDRAVKQAALGLGR